MVSKVTNRNVYIFGYYFQQKRGFPRLPCTATEMYYIWTTISSKREDCVMVCKGTYSGKFSQGKKFAKASATVLRKKFARFNFALYEKL